MALGPSSRGSLRRPPSRTVDPLDPEAILEDAENMPVLARSVSNLRLGLAQGSITPEAARRTVTEAAAVADGTADPGGDAAVATPETATEPIASFDGRNPKDRAREQNEFRALFNQSEPPARQRLASLAKPPPAGGSKARTAPTVVGPAQRAVAAAIDLTGADLPRPDAIPKADFPAVPLGTGGVGKTVTEQRAVLRQAAARQRAVLKPFRDALRPSVSSVLDRSLRSIQAGEDESIAAENGIRVATGSGGGLFATSPAMIRQAEAAEKAQEAPQGEGFEPIRNLFRGLAAGGLGLGESTGTILRYLGGELGIDAIAEMGEDIEAFFHPRMRAFSEAAAKTFRADQNIIENPELLLDLDFLTFTIGQIIPSLLATITPVGVGRAVVRKLAHNALTKKFGVAVSGGVAVAAESERVAITAKQIAGLGKGLARQGSAAQGKINRFIKIGDKHIDIANPDVVAKLARIGRAANAVGFTLGGLSGGALEGSATYRETLDLLMEQGVPEDIARETAENAFLMMTAGSGVLNAIGLKVLLAAAPKLLSVEGVKARAIRGLVEGLTEYLEGPLEAGIQFGQGTITVEQVMQKIKDEANVLPAAILTGFFIPGAGSQLGFANDNIKPPAQSAADTTQVDEPGELPPVDPGAGPAGQAVNVTTEEASATAQAEAEEVDETTVQEPDEGEAAAGEKKKTKPKAATPRKPKATKPKRPEEEVVTGDDLVTEPEPAPELTQEEILKSRAVLATDEDGEFEIRNRTKAQLLDLADEFGVKRSGTKTQLVVRITDQAQKDVEGLDTEEVPSAQTIPDSYPIAPRDEWLSGADFEARGGQLNEMTPDEFLERAAPLEIDEVSRENIDDLKAHIQIGGKLDPLEIFSDDKSETRNTDGRHRAIAAKELGIESIPVLDFVSEEKEGAQTIRETEDKVQVAGTVTEGGVGEGGEDIQQQKRRAKPSKKADRKGSEPRAAETRKKVERKPSGKKPAAKTTAKEKPERVAKSEKLRGQKIPKIGEQGTMTVDALSELVGEDAFKNLPKQTGAKGRLSALKAKISKDGILTPIKIEKDKDGKLSVANGRHRVLIARELGIKEAPVRIVSSEQASIEARAEDEFIDTGFTSEQAEERAVGITEEEIEKIGENTSERIKRFESEPQEQLGLFSEDEESLLSATAEPQEFAVSDDGKAIDIMIFGEGERRGKPFPRRIAYMGARFRAGGKLQISTASVRDASRGRGLGQQMIIKMHELATERGLELISDQVVSTSQIRAYQGLQRKGWEIVFGNDEAVAAGFAAEQETGEPQFVTFIGDSVVIRIRSPQQRLDEIKADKFLDAEGEAAFLSADGKFTSTISFLPTADQETILDATFSETSQDPDRLDKGIRALMLASAKADGFSTIEEANAAGRAEQAEYEEFLNDPVRLKAALDGDEEAIEGTGLHPRKLEERRRFTKEEIAAAGKEAGGGLKGMQSKLPLLDHNKGMIENDIILALLFQSEDTKLILKSMAGLDGGVRKKREQELQAMSREELKAEIDRVFETVVPLFFSATGRGGTSERVSFTSDEQEHIDKLVAKLEPNLRFAARQRIRADREKWAPSKKWARMVPIKVVLGTKGKSKGKVTAIEYKAIQYSFEKDPATGKPYSRAKAERGKLERRKVHLANKIIDAVREVETAAKRGTKWATAIMKQRVWYTAVTARLRLEFGGAADLVADLLGATSPQNPVRQNFLDTIDAARQLSQGKFDVQMKAFVEHIDAGGRVSEYTGPRVSKINGKNYGINTDHTMQAMAKVWRVVRPEQAPKARNFTGNLIGFSNLATIDVWAARFMDRMARRQRIPPKAEDAVSGQVSADGETITGAFGFAQDVFDLASEALDMTSKDLQAVVWFMEKREWSINKWSTEEAAGGSFEQQLDIADYRRVIVGINIQQKGQPTKAQQNKIAVRFKKLFQSDPDSVIFRIASSLGIYSGNAKRVFDIEATVSPDFNMGALVQEVAAIGKAFNQTDVFISRVLAPDANNLNARPGIEVFFKGASTVEQIQPILDALTEELDGLTMVVDPRARLEGVDSGQQFIGVRYQFIPEINARSNPDFVADVSKRGMDVILLEAEVRLYAVAHKLVSLGASGFQIFNYDTLVIGKENYEDYTGTTRGKNQGTGRVWFGQPVATAFEAAVSRHQEGTAADDTAGVRGSEQTGEVDARPDTTTQAADTGQSTAGQISAAADNNLAGDASEVAAPSRPASAAEGAEEFLSDPTPDNPIFDADSRLSTVTDPKDRGTQRKTPLKADIVRAHLLKIINRISSIVQVRIVQSHSDLPDVIQLRMEEEEIQVLRGVYMPTTNTLYIVADSAVSLAGSERTILHEAFGHFAMSSLPTFAAIKARLQKIIENNNDPVIRRLVKDVQARGVVSEDQFLEEVIAHMSENMSSANAVMKEVIALVKEMVRALGFNVEMNNTDMMALIRTSRRRIERKNLAVAGFGIDRNSEKYMDFLKSNNLRNLHKASSDQETGIALEALSKEFDLMLFSASATMTPELDDEWDRKMNTPFRELSWPDRMHRSMQVFHDMSWNELTQGLIDTFDAVKTNDYKAYGALLDSRVGAYKAMSTIRNMNNVMGAVMRHGIPALKEHFITIVEANGKKRKVKGLNFVNPENGEAWREIFTPLKQIGGEDQLRNWEKWMVATRAAGIILADKAAKRKGKRRHEKLIDQELIDKTLQWGKDNVADNGKTYDKIFNEVNDKWQAVNNANLDLAVATGVINQKEREVWQTLDYIPFWREMSALEANFKPGKSGRRVDVSSAGLFRLTGSVERDGSPTRLEGNVVDSMFMNTAYLLDRSYRNEAMRRLVDAAVVTGAFKREPQQARPKRIPAIKVDDLIKMLFNSGLINAKSEEDAIDVFHKTFSEEEKNDWMTFFNHVAPQGPNLVTVMVKGKPVYYFVEDRLLLRSIVGMQGKNYGMWMTAMRTSKKWLTIGVTTDPAFMLANWMRDTVQTLIVSDAPLHSWSDPIKSVREAFNDSPAMMALAYAGRGGGGFYDLNPEKIRDLLKELGVPGTEVDGFMKTVLSPSKIVRFWKRIGTASEFGNRVRVYNSRVIEWDRRIAELGARGIKGQAAMEQAISEGVASPEEAAYEAQDLLNFTRSGDFVIIQNLIQVVPFLNARIQGINKLYRGFNENRLAFASKGGALAALSLGLAIMNDDDDRYNDLPEWDKDTYYHFWIQGEHWRLPKPFESGFLFSTIPERIWRAGKGIDGWDEFSRSMLHGVLDTFAFNPIPQLAKPWLESYFNTNIFTSTPIIPAGMENMLPQSQYDWRTGEFAKWVGDAMPDFMPDVMQSPKRIEHLMRGYFGALGVYSMSLANVMTESIMHGPERAFSEIAAMRLHEMPVIKRFKQADVPHTTRWNRMLWETVREADAVSRTLKKYVLEGQGQKALGLAYDEKKLLALRPVVRKIANQVSKINKQINQISLDRRLSPERRATLRDKLLNQRNALTKRVEAILDYL